MFVDMGNEKDAEAWTGNHFAVTDFMTLNIFGYNCSIN